MPLTPRRPETAAPAAPAPQSGQRLLAALLRRGAKPPCPAWRRADTGASCAAIERDILALLAALDAGARRKIRLAPCGAREMSADERALVFLIAAVQNGRGHEAQMRAEWLARPAHRRQLAGAAARLADALADIGIYLPAPETAPAAIAGTAPVFTVARYPVAANSRR